MASMEQPADFLESLRADRLNSYRHTPQDINAHFNDEGQIQSDYHKRFVFELIQNADDAMQDTSGARTVRFELTDDDTLLVANTGRPISRHDVRALCTMSYTTKDRRASIGHKGRGFSSVLDITEQPQIFSCGETSTNGISFEFNRKKAQDEIQAVVKELDDWSLEETDGYPLMRLPFQPETVPGRVEELLSNRYNTVFCFQLKNEKIKRDVVKTISEIERNTTLFLQELEQLELAINEREEIWTIKREVAELESERTSLTFVTATRHIDGKVKCADTFALFSRNDVKIGEHIGGIDDNTWGDVKYTRIGLALRVEERATGTHLRRIENHPNIHVFLPTSERCPLPVLVNGAFHTAISRTSINVTSAADNYNAFLLKEVANLIATDLQQYAEKSATTAEEFIECLDFTHLTDEQRSDRESLSGRFVEALREEFAHVQFVPRFSPHPKTDPRDNLLSISEVVLPYYSSTRSQIAPFVARIYGSNQLTNVDLNINGWFPSLELLEPKRVEILESLNAKVLTPYEIPNVLGDVPDSRSPLNKYPEPEEELAVDPILQVLIWIWETISDQDEIADRFRQECRRSAVFPVGTPDKQIVEHVAKSDDSRFFFPPRRTLPPFDLSGIQFLTPPVYRPEIPVDTRTQSRLIENLKPALEAIWDVSEFDLEEVLQAAVYPKLASPQQPNADDSELRDIRVLDLIRRLADRSIDPSNPLPFIERSGTVHRLCLLPLPTRSGEWKPAYTVYFGEDWQPEISDEKRIEPLLTAADIEAPYLAHPDTLPDEIGFSENTGENGQSGFNDWKSFFKWLGVAGHIRLTTFFKPKDRRDLQATLGLNRPESGSVLNQLPDDDWMRYHSHLNNALNSSERQRGKYDSIYRVHGIEFFNSFMEAANQDQDVAEKLFRHIAEWWREHLRSFQHPILATHDVTSFSRRNRNCPKEHEQRRVGMNLWLWQLKYATWCPSNRGQTKPEYVWLPSETIHRQFEIDGESLLPVLPEAVLDIAKRVQDLMDELGIRKELSSTSFSPKDAELVVNGVARTFSDEPNEVIADSLRQIKPVYRYVSELLPALTRDRKRTDKTWVDVQNRLQKIPVLCQGANDSFRFVAAYDALFIRSPEVLGRIPLSDAPIFILQEDEAVRIGTYFGMSDLEVIADASPVFSDERPSRTDELRDGLSRIAPFLLCRLEAERSSQELIDQDLTRMRSFIESIEVVDEIEVAYTLESDDREITATPAFYLDKRGRRRNELPLPFVRAANQTDTQNQYVAQALCDLLEVTQFEGIITLLNAESDEQRLEYLRLAGAPATRHDIQNKRRSLRGESPGRLHERVSIGELNSEPTGLETESTSTTQAGPESNTSPSQQSSQHGTTHPVYDPDELLIDGNGITIRTTPEETTRGTGVESQIQQGTSTDSNSSSRASTVSQEYRSTIDRVGTSIAIQYEHNRLTREYDCSTPSKYVFETHDEDSIEKAQRDSIAEPVLRQLHKQAELPIPYPGFDILTVNPITGEADRLIELKSSGHNIRTPSITWNEWKTAGTSAVQDCFYLYIVGNLRKDISSVPYLRAIPNPFTILNSQIRRRHDVTREVKVDITSFKEEAEIMEIEIQIRPSAGGSEP